MSAQSSKSLLLAKLGDRGVKAAEKNKATETTFGNMELPAGIENGVARLAECKFMTIKEGKENAGKLMFFASGIVALPKTHDGVPVQGLRTSIMEMMFDTPNKTRKTIEEHVAWVQNEIKKLLGEGYDPECLTLDNLEATATALVQVKPYFRFRTWKGTKATEGLYKDKEPMTNHQWNGLVVHHADESSGGEVEDGTSANPTLAPKANGKPPSSKPPTRTAVKTPEPEPEPPAEEFSEFDDLDSLVKRSEAGDDPAQNKLSEMAISAGATEEDVANANNWNEVADMVRASSAGEEPEAEVEKEPEEFEPKVGDVFYFKPIDPKTKKPVKKGIEHEVTSVDKKTKTVGLKNLDTQKFVKGVKWDALEGES